LSFGSTLGCGESGVERATAVPGEPAALFDGHAPTPGSETDARRSTRN
jgi:hypothetical protein